MLSHSQSRAHPSARSSTDSSTAPNTHPINHHVGKTLIRFALPSIASVWVFSLYGIIDGIFVGQVVGAEALAAVNLSLPFVGVLFAVSIIVSIGAATAAGVQRGAGQYEKGNRIFSTAVYSLFGFGLAACSLSFIFLEDIAWLLGARGAMIDHVSEYLCVLLFFNTAYLVSYALEVFCKADGFPGRELLAICMAAMTNILLDYLFIIEWDMGLTGAALATGIAQSVSLSFLLLHFLGFMRSRGTLRLIAVKPSWLQLKGFVRIGLPDGITEMSMGLILLAFNNAIAIYMGVPALAAFSVIGYISIMMLQTFLGLTQGMQPLVSFLNGQSKHSARATQIALQQLLRLTLFGALGLGLFAYGLIYFFGASVAGLFLDDAHLILLSHQLMILFCLSFILMGLNVVIAGFFTALEQPMFAGGISILRGGVLVGILLMITPSLWGTESIWFIPLISELLVLGVSLLLLKRFKLFQQLKPCQY